MADEKRISKVTFKASKMDMISLIILLGEEQFIKYIWMLYPQYDIYETVYLDEITLVHRYFLKRKKNEPKPKPETFDRYVTPLMTLTELTDVIKEG